MQTPSQSPDPSTPSTIWIHKAYQSQFDLLGAMAAEIAGAFIALGYDARLIDIAHDPSPTQGLFLFLNTPQSLAQLPQALFTPNPTLKAVQLHVDHPFALPDSIIDQWNQHNNLENFHLHLPCLDDAHLLRPRFPNLIHSWTPHGIPQSTLSNPDHITQQHHANRPFDVVCTGSIRSQDEIDKGLNALDQSMTIMVTDVVHLMLKEPWLGYVAAVDLALGSRGVITGNWSTQKHFWGLVTAIVNRHRRTQTVQSLQGLKVGVFGSSAWKEHCTGTIEYAGEVAYADSASAFAQGRIGLAWGPTQFVHSYSERIMQAMAGGSCVIADDRLLVRRDFNGAASPAGDTVRLFDWGDPNAARAAADAQLADPQGSLNMAKRSRELVERTCLWTHRVKAMVDVQPSSPTPSSQVAQ
jgi:hypothetical protein